MSGPVEPLAREAFVHLKSIPHPILAWTLALPLLAVLPGGCAPETDEAEIPKAITIVEGVEVLGSVSGRILNGLTNEPLEGVTVDPLPRAAEDEIESGSDGSFTATGLPAGASISFRYSLEGHGPAEDRVTILGEAGNFPQNNGAAFSGPIGLFPLLSAQNQGFVTRVRVLAPNGTPISNAQVWATLDVGWLIAGDPQGTVTVVGATSSGEVALLGLPDLAALAGILPQTSLRVSVVPPSNSDAQPAYAERTLGQVLSSSVWEIRLSTADEEPMDAGSSGDGGI
jgi:hypothetical protein